MLNGLVICYCVYGKLFKLKVYLIYLQQPEILLHSIWKFYNFCRLLKVIDIYLCSTSDWKFAADQFVKMLPDKVIVHCKWHIIMLSSWKQNFLFCSHVTSFIGLWLSITQKHFYLTLFKVLSQSFGLSISLKCYFCNVGKIGWIIWKRAYNFILIWELKHVL